jgi:hypothetical protein
MDILYQVDTEYEKSVETDSQNEIVLSSCPGEFGDGESIFWE